MNTITKTFTQKYISTDMEARYWDWIDSKESYEDAVARLGTKYDPWWSAVRIVEKTFDPETFTISTKVIKTTEALTHSWNNDSGWNITLEERAGE